VIYSTCCYSNSSNHWTCADRCQYRVSAGSKLVDVAQVCPAVYSSNFIAGLGIAECTFRCAGKVKTKSGYCIGSNAGFKSGCYWADLSDWCGQLSVISALGFAVAALAVSSEYWNICIILCGQPVSTLFLF